MAVVIPPMNANPVSKANLYMSCSHLPNMDVLSKTDAQILVTLTDSKGKRVIGKTEVVKDNLNPSFATCAQFDYSFEEVQNLTFEIFDVDADGPDYMGKVECTVGDIFGSRGQQLARPIDLKKPKLTGKTPVLLVRAEEEQPGIRASVNFKISGNHLDKKDFGLFAKSDPYLLIHKQNTDGTFTLVHRTETIMKTLDPLWKPFSISITKLCNGDVNLPLLIECFDWDKNSEDDFIGSFRTTLDTLTKTKLFDLINEKKARKKKSYKNSGVLSIDFVEIVPEFSFLDYLAGGTQLNLMIGIDYTASNGDPRVPKSLHFRDPSGNLNQYQQAIWNVGNVLMPYDYDGNVPVYGFGGKLPNGTTSHCFALTGDPVHPEVHGLPAIMDLYAKSFGWVALHGPTNFAPLIRQASDIAREFQGNNVVNSYLLLLIITDGEITDMSQTIDAICEASALPMSIVIVGVGSADFSKMDLLDGDDRMLSGSRGPARRDIVQFVPFQKYNNPVQLAAETLAELPTQFLEYMKQNKIRPAARIIADTAQLIAQVEVVTTTTQIASTTIAPPNPNAVVVTQQ